MSARIDEIEWVLDSWLKPEALQAALPVLKILFWVATAFFVLKVFKRFGSASKRRAIGRSYRILFAVIAILFAGILAYQATWQLAGFTRPEFMEFMKRYNRRPDNPADRIVRGRILDSIGNVLAAQDRDLAGKRNYDGGAAFCHVVGYEDPLYGMSGVEAAANDVLNGSTIEYESDWDRIGRNLFIREDLRGNDVVLTLLAPLQFEAHRQMSGRRGAVVFLDPSDGSILVLYSSPGFDPEGISGKLFRTRDKNAPMLNRALQGRYPPGSTMKLLVAAAALEQGLDPLIDCPAEGYRAGSGNRPIRDHEYYAYEREGRTWRGHGRLDMREALAKSSNIYFAKLGVRIGGENIHSAVVRAGLTRAWTILDGATEDIASMAGRFPPLSDQQVAKTAQVSIGQGDMLVTPLHMALLAGAIGRKGTLWTPHLLKDVKPKPAAVAFDAGAAARLAGMMRHAVRTGTGRPADLPGLELAAKTGTAQNPHGDDHGWFVGFAPVGDPTIAFAVIVENGGYGSRSALPVAKAVLEKAQEIGYFDRVDPEERR